MRTAGKVAGPEAVIDVAALPFAARYSRLMIVWTVVLFASAQTVLAAPFASMVMDARTGEVLQADNADTRLHPASLTKMMTLYIAFEAIKSGEISLDTDVRISANAANEAPSKLGLRAGQTMKLRYLIRAAAIKSANDCATAIGEAIGGSEAGFAKRMNATARRLGMTKTTFKNANGLTAAGHLSTARDMTVLGRHLFYDHPEFYNLFSRRSADVGGRTVTSHNRLLDNYDGADGIKTGYTGPAGFNLVASAQRGNVRIIATVFGGTSTAARDAKVAELLDLGFKRAKSDVKVNPPKTPAYVDPDEDPIAAAAVEAAVAAGIDAAQASMAAKTLRVSGLILKSPRPHWRPGAAPVSPPSDLLAAMDETIKDALDGVRVDDQASVIPSALAPIAAAPAPPRPDLTESPSGADGAAAVRAVADASEPLLAEATAESEGVTADGAADPAVAMTDVADAAIPADAQPLRPADVMVPVAAPPEPDAPDMGPVQMAEAALPELTDPAADPDDVSGEDATLGAEAGDVSGERLDAAPLDVAPPSDTGPERLALARIVPETFAADTAPVVISRLSTSGGRHWGINVGSYASQYEAEKVLLKTALQEIGTLDEALRKVARTKRGFDANFLGLTQDMAVLACQRLSARSVPCTTLGPAG